MDIQGELKRHSSLVLRLHFLVRGPNMRTPVNRVYTSPPGQPLPAIGTFAQ